MLFISHRGNLKGPDKNLENDPTHILYAIKKGYDVEIDVWYYKNNFYLGHDNPKHKINLSFLNNNKLWCHAKNLIALQKMLENRIHCFWHQNDTITLTSENYVWTYPGKPLIANSIAVLPEIIKDWDTSNATGICSDFIYKYTDKHA
jgi:hypothetical protein